MSDYDDPPPVPQSPRRSRLPPVAWIGLAVAGLLMLGLIGFGVYLGFGLAKATSKFTAEFERTLSAVSADFDRLLELGGADLSTIESKAEIEARLAVYEELSGHLAIAVADATTGERFAARLREGGLPESAIDDAIEAFVAEDHMQQVGEWLEAEVASAVAGTALLRLAQEHYGSWSVDGEGELSFSEGVDAAIRERMTEAAAEVDRAIAAAEAVNFD